MDSEAKQEYIFTLYGIYGYTQCIIIYFFSERGGWEVIITTSHAGSA